MTRSTVFIQTDPGNRDLHELFFIQAPHHFFPGSVITLNPRDMIVRKEVQMFQVLRNSRCIVMTVRTELRHLTDLNPRECTDLAKEIRGWPKEVAVQKGRDLWKRIVLGYLKRKSITQDDGMMADEGEFTDLESD
ncbi:hypothetical protein DM02DRAFT_616761 [Periconia macrospinosa]|uniref:Uncharacterized protein n=1 Tax=Periconia macrospinosa TaxID=97972 RepID=A0A2V1DIK4_9PLEO|nr:hypothetical protein DM02DRAFT_616761 [Periconia macrospinosa]